MTDDIFGADDTDAVHSIARRTTYSVETLPDFDAAYSAVVYETARTLAREVPA